jgi:catechol 2,3-dioxygenase-like lactoylglutathione lyase family enzyme
MRALDRRQGLALDFGLAFQNLEMAMIGYVTVGTNDLPRATAFYEALLGPLGAKEMWKSPKGVGWGVSPDSPMLAAMLPFDGKPACVGNGSMVGLVVQTTAQVDELYQRAIALGAQDEGAAGPRGNGFYAGYFRDLDGNKLNVFCYG